MLTRCRLQTSQVAPLTRMIVSSHHATIIKSSPIPSGTSIVVIGGDGKVVLNAGDIIKVQSNVASSIDVVLSYLEQT